MEPTLRDGQIAIFSSIKAATAEDIVLARRAGTDYVKRFKLSPSGYSLRGDNIQESYDLEDIDLQIITASLIYPQE